MKKQKNRTCSGRISEQMSLLEFLKERSGIRQSKLEAYLDLVDKVSVQYIPKDLCRQEFTLSDGQFVITITELAECWHWHRATVRAFIEQLEKMGQIAVTRLTKSQIITIPSLAETPAAYPIDTAMAEFRHKMRTALSAVIETTFHQVLGQGTEQSKVTSLLPFFYKDLGGDWLSFIEAAKAISELALDGSSPALLQESAAVKSQFQSLCRPFLAVIANREVPVLFKESSNL